MREKIRYDNPPKNQSEGISQLHERLIEFCENNNLPTMHTIVSHSLQDSQRTDDPCNPCLNLDRAKAATSLIGDALGQIAGKISDAYAYLKPTSKLETSTTSPSDTKRVSADEVDGGWLRLNYQTGETGRMEGGSPAPSPPSVR